MTYAILLVDGIPPTRAHRDHLYLLLTILRWITCDHRESYRANRVDGYKCPTCGRNGYGGSPTYDPEFKAI